MRIEYVVLADAVQAVGGKLYILGGGWSIFRSANFPTPIQIGLAISLSFGADEAGMKVPLSIIIADEAGVPIVPEMKGQIEIGPPITDLPNGITRRMPFAANMGIMLPRAGRYTIAVRVGASAVQIVFEAIFAGPRVEIMPEGGGTPERGN
jgi:Family of unknown function (DUF6941)